jgi:hypothetical protein
VTDIYNYADAEFTKELIRWKGIDEVRDRLIHGGQVTFLSLPVTEIQKADSELRDIVQAVNNSVFESVDMELENLLKLATIREDLPAAIALGEVAFLVDNDSYEEVYDMLFDQIFETHLQLLRSGRHAGTYIDRLVGLADSLSKENMVMQKYGLGTARVSTYLDFLRLYIAGYSPGVNPFRQAGTEQISEDLQFLFSQSAQQCPQQRCVVRVADNAPPFYFGEDYYQFEGWPRQRFG